jgi:ribosomal protein L32
MSEILSTTEIEELVAAINAEDTEAEDFVPLGRLPNVYSLADFETFLTKRKFEPEKVYGHHFDKDITMCRFFDSKDGENILVDIERKNAEQGMGNITIPNTNIKLINYSVCPKCGTIFSFQNLIDYYKNPMPDPWYATKGRQIREDARVRCSECGTYFLPALVIADGTPKNETQFLCRMQTAEAIEQFFLKKDVCVLSKNRGNIMRGNGFITIRNDVSLRQLESKPTLISNMLQYTPAGLIPNLIDGSNVDKGDILFGRWNPIHY